LAIAKDLLTFMGGSIGVESEPGLGVTVWFALPLPPGAAAKDLCMDSHPALFPLSYRLPILSSVLMIELCWKTPSQS